jgi:ketosteroid isomerase-like protein
MPTIAETHLTAQDRAALREMFDDTIRFINAGDWPAWAAEYAEDGVLQPPNAPTLRGRSNLLEWGRAFPPIEEFSFSDVQVDGEGSFAWGMSAYMLRVKDQAPDIGKQLVVFRRALDGAWKVVAASFNSDLPAPGAARSE